MTAPGGPSRRLTYQPGLDGLRAVALLGVIAYHAGIDSLQGGFLGVSSFFTLSGFLITSLLLSERLETGGVELGSFWVRRARRLLPAALVTIVGTVVLAALIADDSQLARLRLDSLSSLFHFSNWRFIVGGDSYGSLFESPSFFRHFWSLAVEEQYYLVFPLLVVGGLRLWQGPGRAFTVALGAVAVAAVFWPIAMLAAGASTDRLYFGTDTRLGELVLGALLAVWWVRRGHNVPDRPATLTAGAVVALGVLATMWATAHPDDHYLYRGGLSLHAVLTIVVIVAAIAPRGPARAVLSYEPVRRLGVISYGAYLFHWPVLLWLQQETAMGPEQRFVLGTVITVGLAELSHRFVEQPIRQGSGGATTRQLWIVAPASLAVAALVVGITAWQTPAEAPIDFAAAEAELAELVTDSPPAPSTSAAPSTAVPDAEPAVDEDPPEPVTAPVRVAGFGDSTALMTGLGVAMWADEHPDQLTMVEGEAKLGCGLVSGGIRRLEDREVPVPDECDDWLIDWIDSIQGEDLDVSMVQVGAWDIVDHQLESGGPFLAIGRDDEYEALLRANLEAAIDALLDHSDLVVLLAHPDIGQGRLDTVPAGASYPEYDEARSIRWREIVDEAEAANSAVVVVDLAAWVDDHPDDLRLRPDGVHFSYESTREVADWLAPEILAAYETWLAAAESDAST